MIFVTGGNGFLGSHLLIELCKMGKEVRALKRNSSDIDFVRRLFSFYNKESLFDGIEWVDGDILDFSSLRDAMQTADQVYHCAAIVSFSGKYSKRMLHTNVHGTENVVNAAIETGVKKIIHVSSIAALGNNEMISEETKWDRKENHSFYAKSKYLSELELYRGIAEGLEALIVRPSVIIGPWKPTSGIGKMFGQVEKGLTYYTKGGSGFVDVRDVANTMILLMESSVKNDNFILSSENLGYRELLAMIAGILQKPVPSKCANTFQLEMAWRLFALNDFITNKDSGFNKSTAAISQSVSKYSNKKLLDTLSFQYFSIKESLANCNKFYQYLSV